MIVSSYLGQCTIKGIFISVHITTIVFGKCGYHVFNDYACMHNEILASIMIGTYPVMLRFMIDGWSFKFSL